jgi:hypothetical protein
MGIYRQVMVDGDHPIALLSGQYKGPGSTRARVYEHKATLYDAIGPGVHPCHWCGRGLIWRRGAAGNTLIADHLDQDPTNNDPANLVPACNGCNTIRHRTRFRPGIADDEPFVATSDGYRTRAVELTCAECGSPFLASTCRVKRKTVSLCSNSCAGKRGARSRWGS